MASPLLEFYYDVCLIPQLIFPILLILKTKISCPFAFIAFTRVQALADRTNATLIQRPVLLGAIYRATAAPQGAGGSASDVFNPTKKAVGRQSMVRTFKRYGIKDNPPPQHPRKTVNALRLLYCVPDGEERRVLSAKLYSAYWIEGRDVSDDNVLLQIAKESGIASSEKLGEWCFSDAKAKKELEQSTADAIARGAFGVPGFWIPAAQWSDVEGKSRKGRFFWGQDRMHFVEATLLSLAKGGSGWASVPGLRSLMPRCIPTNTPPSRTKVEFWFDFSSPWAFLGYTQLARLQRTFPSVEIQLKPFLLGILFREIGAPNMPMLTVSKPKAQWSRQDHADWTAYWNAVNSQEGGKDKHIDFHWATQFPIRTPTALRVCIVEPKTIPFLCKFCRAQPKIKQPDFIFIFIFFFTKRNTTNITPLSLPTPPVSASWEQNTNISSPDILSAFLTTSGFNGPDLLTKANAPAAREKLHHLTAQARDLGLCGVPTYRVLRDNDDNVPVGGLVWGQDEIAVLEDLIAGWDVASDAVAEVGRVDYAAEEGRRGARL